MVRKLRSLFFCISSVNFCPLLLAAFNMSFIPGIMDAISVKEPIFRDCLQKGSGDRTTGVNPLPLPPLMLGLPSSPSNMERERERGEAGHRLEEFSHVSNCEFALAHIGHEFFRILQCDLLLQLLNQSLDIPKAQQSLDKAFRIKGFQGAQSLPRADEDNGAIGGCNTGESAQGRKKKKKKCVDANATKSGQ